MFTHWSANLSSHTLVHLPMCPPFNPSTLLLPIQPHTSIYLLNCPFIHASGHLSIPIHLLCEPTRYPSVCPHTHPLTHPSTLLLPIYLSTHPSNQPIHSLVHSFIHSSNQPFIYPPTHPLTHQPTQGGTKVKQVRCLGCKI